MLSEERYSRILGALQEKKAVSILQLVELVGVSESTIRRDLTYLDEIGKLRKVHGGATTMDKLVDTKEETVHMKAGQNKNEKESIAQYAANMITDDDFVFIDAGTTTERVIEYIGETKATFATNGVAHARMLVGKGLKTIMIGGMVKPETEAVVGTEAILQMKKYNFTKAFLGANGISVDKGFTTPDPEEARMKETAIKQAYVSFVLADHSKFGRVSSITFAELEQACIITDEMSDNKYSEHAIIKETKRNE